MFAACSARQSHSKSQPLTLPLQHLPPLPPLQPQCPTHTPVNSPLLASLLTGHPNSDFTTYLLQGLTRGFKVGCTGPHYPLPSSNLRSALARPQVIDKYLEAECQAGHTLGPFPSPPLPSFVVNPLGAVPKKRSAKWCLIMHLSCVNDGIDNNDFPLRYSTVYDAIVCVIHLGRGPSDSAQSIPLTTTSSV